MKQATKNLKLNSAQWLAHSMTAIQTISQAENNLKKKKAKCNEIYDCALFLRNFNHHDVKM